MIYLVCECKSGLGEDTFWTWFETEFTKVTFLDEPIIPLNFNENTDCMIIYSTRGQYLNPYNYNAKVFVLCWELYPEMKKMLNSIEWDYKINTTIQSTKNATKIFVASTFAEEYYKEHGIVDIMKLGVNTDLFKPINDKPHLKNKYDIPLNKTVGYWGGTNHIMKGFDQFLDYAKNNPDIFWIIVWKHPQERGYVPENIKSKVFTLIPQQTIAELLSCSDFFLCTSRLRPFYMTEIEALACNVPFVFTNDIEKDFKVSSEPRNDVFQQGWDRPTVKNQWLNLFRQYNIDY